MICIHMKWFLCDDQFIILVIGMANQVHMYLLQHVILAVWDALVSMVCLPAWCSLWFSYSTVPMKNPIYPVETLLDGLFLLTGLPTIGVNKKYYCTWIRYSKSLKWGNSSRTCIVNGLADLIQSIWFVVITINLETVLHPLYC